MNYKNEICNSSLDGDEAYLGFFWTSNLTFDSTA